MLATHHLIVAHDVINEGHDRSHLSAMFKKAKAALATGHRTLPLSTAASTFLICPATSGSSDR